MLRYFSISTTLDYEKAGNVFPQASSVYTNEALMESLKTDQKKYQAYEAMQNTYKKKADDKMVWEFQLMPKAVLTDVLSKTCFLTKGLLISNKLYTILADYDLTGIEFIKCIVHSKKDSHSYWYLYPRVHDLVEKYLDMEATTFVLTDYPDENFRHEYKIKNIQDYRQRMANSRNRILTTKDGLYLKKFLPVEDIIELTYFNSGLFISEKLKRRLSTSGITGLRINDNPVLIGNK